MRKIKHTLPGACFGRSIMHLKDSNYRQYLDFCTIVNVLINSRVKGKALRSCKWSTPVCDFVHGLNYMTAMGIEFYSKPLGRKAHRKITAVVAAVNRASSMSNSILTAGVMVGHAGNGNMLRYHLGNINIVHNVENVERSALGVALLEGPDAFKAKYLSGYKFAKLSFPKRLRGALKASINSVVLPHDHRIAVETALCVTDFHDD